MFPNERRKHQPASCMHTLVSNSEFTVNTRNIFMYSKQTKSNVCFHLRLCVCICLMNLTSFYLAGPRGQDLALKLLNAPLHSPAWCQLSVRPALCFSRHCRVDASVLLCWRQLLHLEMSWGWELLQETTQSKTVLSFSFQTHFNVYVL